LRFPEYSDKWLECELQDIADLSKGAGISKDQLSETGESCILYGELYTKYKSEVISNVVSKTNIESTNLVRSKANDVIIPSSGETAIDISTARCVPYDNILLGGDLNIIRLKDQDGRFFSYQLNGVRKLDIAQIAQGVSVVHLYGESLKRLKVRYPSKSEQEKISSLLSVLDERIETQNRIINEMQSLISGITQRISKHSSVRMVLLSELLVERNEKNTELFPVHSVSVSEGVINQIDYLGRSFSAADTSHYNVAYRGDIIYTKSPTGEFPFGIVKRNSVETNVSVSPLYGVYKPVSDEVALYIHYYFCSPLNAQNYLHKLIQKGAKNTINITNQRFLENIIPLPDKKTLTGFVKLISAVSAKLELEKSLLETLQTQKRYLLTQMFV
jgi:type I restriction enzyme S subunit